MCVREPPSVEDLITRKRPDRAYREGCNGHSRALGGDEFHLERIADEDFIQQRGTARMVMSVCESRHDRHLLRVEGLRIFPGESLDVGACADRGETAAFHRECLRQRQSRVAHTVRDRRNLLHARRGLITSLELASVMGKSGIADLDPDFVEPYPNVLKAMAGVEQCLDVRPRLAYLPCLRAGFLPLAGAESGQVQFVLCVVIQAASIS